MPSRLAKRIEQVNLLQNALLTEEWAEQHLYGLGKGKYFRELQTKRASALLIHEEIMDRCENSNNAGP